MSEKTFPPGGQDASPAQQDVDPDRTILVPRPEPQETETTSPPSELADEDAPLQQETEDADNDQTLLMPMPAAEEPEALDRTIIGAPVIRPPPADAPQGNRGSTYSPMSAPIAAAPQAMETDHTLQASTMTASIGAATAAPMAEPLRTLEPGSVINNMYRVDERVDHGGMGRVFRGTEISTGESVAIKVILPEMAEDPRVGQMFRREARTLRQLHHDAIVRYFAYVPPDTNFNLHALVMGFIQGTKLSDHIKRNGPLAEAEVCQLCTRLAGGLRRAHGIGVVHRDLSPDNVMLPDGDIARAVLIDFGISRSSKVRDETIGNEFAGKLKYVSPEQLGAYGGDAQAQSDVYSFALLMIVMLTGQAMSMGDSIVEAVQKRQSVPDLSAVPSAFQTLLYQMLQSDPEKRMSSMDMVISALSALESGEETDTKNMPEIPTPTENHMVPGLQAAPRANAQGDGFVTSAPGMLKMDAAGVLPEEKSGGAGIGIGMLVIAGLIGAGVWFGMRQVSEGETTESDPMARTEGTIPTYLAQSLADATCVYAAPRVEGGYAGRIEGFAERSEVLAPVSAGWPHTLGGRPEMIHRPVESGHCAALDLARAFQGAAGAPLEIALDQDVTSRSEGVVGTLYGADERENWIGLIAPNGRVFSLMSQLEEPVGNQRQFSFRLPSAQPGIYMVIATGSEKALVRAGAMKDGTAAEALLPLFQTELETAGAAAVDLAVVEITR